MPTYKQQKRCALQLKHTYFYAIKTEGEEQKREFMGDLLQVSKKLMGKQLNAKSRTLSQAFSKNVVKVAATDHDHHKITTDRHLLHILPNLIYSWYRP